MGVPRPIFVYFCYFQTQIFTEKTVGVSRIWTRIVRREDERADHVIATTAHTARVLGKYIKALTKVAIGNSITQML